MPRGALAAGAGRKTQRSTRAIVDCSAAACRVHPFRDEPLYAFRATQPRGPKAMLAMPTTVTADQVPSIRPLAVHDEQSYDGGFGALQD
jgi:hypothetical protein